MISSIIEIIELISKFRKSEITNQFLILRFELFWNVWLTNNSFNKCWISLFILANYLFFSLLFKYRILFLQLFILLCDSYFFNLILVLLRINHFIVNFGSCFFLSFTFFWFFCFFSLLCFLSLLFWFFLFLILFISFFALFLVGFFTLIFFTLFITVESPLRNIYDRQTKTFLQYLSQRFGCVIINLLPTLNISSMRLVSWGISFINLFLFIN